MAVGIGKICRVSAPEYLSRLLERPGPGGNRFGKHGADGFLVGHVVGERDAAETAALGRDARVLRQLVARPDRQQHVALEPKEHDTCIGIVVFHRQPEAVAIELQAALEVGDPQRDEAEPGLHQLCSRPSPLQVLRPGWVRSSAESAFCTAGRSLIASRQRTMLG